MLRQPLPLEITPNIHVRICITYLCTVYTHLSVSKYNRNASGQPRAVIDVIVVSHRSPSQPALPSFPNVRVRRVDLVRVVPRESIQCGDDETDSTKTPWWEMAPKWSPSISTGLFRRSAGHRRRWNRCEDERRETAGVGSRLSSFVGKRLDKELDVGPRGDDAFRRLLAVEGADEAVDVIFAPVPSIALRIERQQTLFRSPAASATHCSRPSF